MMACLKSCAYFSASTLPLILVTVSLLMTSELVLQVAGGQRSGTGLRVSQSSRNNNSLLGGMGSSSGRSGLQIGVMRNSSGISGGRTGGGLKIGGSKSGSDSSSNSSTGGQGGGGGGRGSATTSPEVIVVGGGGSLREDEKENLTVGLILPHSMFYQRDYVRAVTSAISFLRNKAKFKFLEKYRLEVQMVMITVSPSPRDILDSLCDKFLSQNVSAILYLTNTELYGRSTAASQYFLQLAGYLGIPVIAWNADNSGLLRRASQAEMILQLAPSVTHQANAMLTILSRYNWHQFAIVTSQIAGHDDFVQAVRDRVLALETEFKFVILATVMVVMKKDLQTLVGSEARILLLYCTREEAQTIFGFATELGLTGANYVWVATQSVIGDNLDAPTTTPASSSSSSSSPSSSSGSSSASSSSSSSSSSSTSSASIPESAKAAFPVGMLGVHFNTSYESLKTEISSVLRVFSQGVEAFYTDQANGGVNLSTSLSCEGLGEQAKWTVGDRFFRFLKNVTVDFDTASSKPALKFNQENTLKSVELQIMNLRPGVSDRQLVWEQIGVWQSWKESHSQLDIKDIIWPGYSHKPPDGVPEKFHLKIAFLEEPPYIKMADPDPVTGKCSPDRGIICRIAPDSELIGLNHSEVVRNSSFYQCCSGFCIDLLLKFAENIGFTFELSRVPDAKWGTLQNGKWNGLVAELINRKVDVALASLMINSEREAAVDFSIPFMDSGVAILTAKRTGIISPTAFLEPFDLALWMLVYGCSVWMILAIFLFEWLSPLGFNMKKEAKPGSRFSFFRSCWLVWARLFQASVHIDPPRGFTAKMVVHVWSMFAVVFLATYTANLAVFMITREESHKFAGIHDVRTNVFNDQTSTLGLDYSWKSVQLGSKNVFLRVWDTSGQERYRQIVSQYVRKSDGVILAYDITDPSSINEIMWYYNFANESGAEKAIKILVGCKADKVQERQISKDVGQLSNPHSSKPPMKFATIPFTHTDSLLAKHHEEMYDHMRQFTVSNVSEGVAAVRDGKLDALIYDGPVLQYEVLQDANGTCQLLIEGSWYAHTGYGLAFPRHSKYLPLFNKNLMEYKESGDLERLKRFYFTGPCSIAQQDPHRMGSSSSNQLALEQFHSAFLLLACGIVFACVLLAVEHLYSKCVRRHCVDRPPSCFTLLSQNMGRPFDFPYGSGTIHERRFRNCLPPVEKYAHECKDPFCQTNLLRTEHHLRMSLLRCHQLENRLRLYVVDNNRRRSKSSSCWPGGTRHQMTFSELSVSAMLSPRDFGLRNHVETTGSGFSSPGALESTSQSIAFKYREHLYRPRLTEISEIETVL